MVLNVEAFIIYGNCILQGTVTTELATTEPLFLEKYRVSFLWDCGHDIWSTNQYLVLFGVCFCLNGLFNIYM